MFNFFANMFGYVLNFIYGIVNNYGIAIIIFTILLKLLMLPISINQQKTMKKNAKMQVKVKELQSKYSNDPTRLNQEMMDLYKQEKMSPFSGCLSSILQFIIILSIFFLVSRPLTYMKHIDKEILDQYTQEVRDESEGNLRYTEIAIIKAKSAEDERVRLNMNFLGLDLSDVPSQNYTDWKVFIIPVLYVITSIVSTKLTTSLNKAKNEEETNKENLISEEKVENEPKKEEIIQDKSSEGKELIDLKKQKKKDDEDQADAMEEMNKQMNLMMPIMSVSIALIAPLGLALYWFISNLLMIGERLLINKFFKEEEE